MKKASREGPGALLSPLGRSFGTTGGQSTASGRILIAKREARKVPKGRREGPREAQERPKIVFLGIFFDVYLENDLSSTFYRFFVDFGMVFGVENGAQRQPNIRKAEVQKSS